MGKQFKRLALVGSAALVVALALPLRADSADSRAPVNGMESARRDIQTYATLFGTTVPEAERRLTLQKRVPDLERVLVLAEPSGFGGLWIEHTPEFRVVVLATPDRTPQVSSIASSSDLAALTQVRPTRFSLARLHADLEILGSSTLRTEFDLSINVPENVVDVIVEDVDRFHALAASSSLRLPPSARIRVGHRSRPVVNVGAGLQLDGYLGSSTCTSNFSIWNGAVGSYGLTTAAHCGPFHKYLGLAYTQQGSSQGGQHDEQWMTTSADTPRNIFWDGSAFRSVLGKVPYSSVSVGTFVCKYGITTGYDCGSVTSVSTQPNGCVPNAGNQYIWVHNSANHNLASPGDSGGPVFYTVDAYGMMVCGANGIDLIYNAYNFMESGLGVVVLTN